MRLHVLQVFVAIVVNPLSVSPAIAQTRSARVTSEEVFAPVQALIEQKLANGRTPSISVSVAQNGEIVWEKGFGWANRERHLAASEHSMYALASVTKLMTASAIMVLRDRKRLDLDRPVNQYLGSAKLTGLAWDASKATVRRVANHTAGLGTYDNGYACLGGEADCREVMIRRFGRLIWPPGERFDYSNLGYGVLGEVVRQVSGMSYSDFLKKQLFAPLTMTHCSVGIAQGLEEYAAERYDGSDGSPADWSANVPSSQQAASSVFCSAHDLVRFGILHLNADKATSRGIISTSAVDEMQHSTVSAGAGRRYGFGWWHEERFGYKVMYASGGYSHASALLYAVPAEKIVVAVLINTNRGKVAQDVADEAVSCLASTYCENRAKAESRKTESPVAHSDKLTSLVGAWRGIIQAETREIPMIVTVDGTEGVTSFIDSKPATVQKVAFRDGQFLAKIVGTSGLYERDPKKAIDLDLQLFLRSGRVLSGGGTMMPLTQPEYGLGTYFIQLTAKPPE